MGKISYDLSALERVQRRNEQERETKEKYNHLLFRKIPDEDQRTQFIVDNDLTRHGCDFDVKMEKTIEKLDSMPDVYDF